MQTINKGAPVDVAIINEMINAIEVLQADSTSSQNKRVSIQDNAFSGGVSSTVKTADSRIQAATFPVTGFQNVAPGSVATFEYALNNFQGVPIVTTTPILLNRQSTTNADVSVMITDINQSKVSGYVTSNVVLSGEQVYLSIIAVGIPAT